MFIIVKKFILQNIIITGTGLIASHLIEKFKSIYNIIVFTTTKSKTKNQTDISYYYWDPKYKVIPKLDYKKIDVIINTSGYTINCRWTKKNRKSIISSRMLSSQILNNLCIEHKIKHFINFSAIGYYEGNDAGIKNENSACGSNFLSKVCQSLEEETHKNNNNFTIFRLPIVFAKNSEIWKKFNKISKYNFFLIPVKNKYRVSWVHIEDVVGAVDFSIKNNLYGIYNLCSNNSYTWEKCYKRFCLIKNKKLYKIYIPWGFLFLILGSRARIFRDIQNVSNNSIINLKFKFKYVSLLKCFKSLK